MDYKYFSKEELKCKCGQCNSIGEEMMPSFMRKLEFIRKVCDFPFVISSAYRCPQYNLKVSTTGTNGPHTTGRAVDISIRGQKAYQLIKEALNAGLTGIGIDQEGPIRFIHIDDLTEEDGFPRPTIWSY